MNIVKSSLSPTPEAPLNLCTPGDTENICSESNLIFLFNPFSFTDEETDPLIIWSVFINKMASTLEITWQLLMEGS